MQVADRALKEFLLDSGAMTRAELDRALESAGGASLYDALASRGQVEEDELRRAAAHVAGVPFVVLERHELQPEALMLVPEPLARAHNIVAFRLEENTLEVALLDLDDLSHLEFLRKEFRVLPRLTTGSSVKQGLLHYQKLLREKFAAIASGGAQAAEALLRHALLSQAHSVHLDLETAGVLVRYRIGELLHEAMVLPKEAAHIMGRFKELAKLSFTLNAPQEGHFKAALDGGESVGVRVATAPTAGGERMTLHLLPHAARRFGYTLESLGFHGEALEETYKLLHKKSGLIVVAGAAHSGKTTTLYTLLDMLSRNDRALVSIENEIEHRMPHVAQMQARPEIGLGIAAGVRAALRQDPDVVMIGDVRDNETALLAASAAKRGIVVLAGIEASDAADGTQKLLRLGVPEERLTEALSGTVSVALVRRVCQNCKEAFRLARIEGEPLEDKANFGKVLAALKEEGIVGKDAQWKDLSFARAAGCSQCEGGYSGFAGLQEVARREGGSLNIIEDGLFKAAAGITTAEEVFRVAAGESLD